VKLLIAYIGFSWVFLYSASTTFEINKSQKNLSKTSSAKEQANIRLGKIAKDIQSAEKEIVSIEKKIDTLGQTQVDTKKKYENLKKELFDFDRDLNETTQRLERKSQKFIHLLSEQFSIIFAMNQSHEPTEESIILYEVYDTYKKQNKGSLAVLRREISSLKSSQKSKLLFRTKVEKEIVSIRDKRKLFADKKDAKIKLLKKLAVYEEKYNSKLEKIVDKQNSLRSTWAKLNILRKKEVDIARKRASEKKEAMRVEKRRQREIRRAKAKVRQAKEALLRAKTEKERAKARLASQKADKEEQRVYKASTKIKKVNSSYKTSSTYKYRGGKTISPLNHARVIKGFGTYIDPIYKIKIFNESITLQSGRRNAKVKNVLNGKVVFAGKSSMLGKVVVVSHSRKIHTVYAGLSKIAPTITVGRKIKKGYVVGKVSRKLIFQATKNSKHINPLELIAL
jgi:murein DD-endopeptidase MepM/ murein hydrolase activator NlpD